MADLPTAYPLRDLFDAAVRGSSIRLTCRECRHRLFNKKGWRDSFADVRKRYVCLMCLHRRLQKVRSPELDLVLEEPTDINLPVPSEMDWKRELRRRR